jgi:hypothetical protein
MRLFGRFLPALLRAARSLRAAFAISRLLIDIIYYWFDYVFITPLIIHWLLIFILFSSFHFAIFWLLIDIFIVIFIIWFSLRLHLIIFRWYFSRFDIIFRIRDTQVRMILAPFRMPVRRTTQNVRQVKWRATRIPRVRAQSCLPCRAGAAVEPRIKKQRPPHVVAHVALIPVLSW